MIQRIQSVFLVLGVACLALGFFVGAIDREAHAALSWFIPGAAGSLGIAALIGLVAIFLFGDRKRQRKFIVGGQYVILAALAVIVTGLTQSGTLPTMRSTNPASWFAIGFPLGGFLFFRFARRGVEADIKLIESVDRIR
jgi:peptidoglycan/LPS O-acetylase OafA/YrhL